jgi:hypothetical protein
MGYNEEVLTVFKEAGAGPRELRINFGVFAGRTATPAEIDELAGMLLPELGDVTITAEDRRELNGHSETSLHQVRIDLPRSADVERVVEVAEEWAQAHIEDRHADVVDAPIA